MITALYIIVALLALANLRAELCRALMMFQQNSYRPSRFRKWIATSGDSTNPWRLCGIIVFLAMLVPHVPVNAAMILAAVFLIFSYTNLRRKKYKKPLVMTSRATRILATAFFVCAILIGVAITLLSHDTILSRLYIATVVLMGCYCCSLIIIVVSNWILKPVENHITRRYIKDAERRLAAMPDLRIIGVTGSYGKTTTKHYLARILSEKYETLMTPGSFNTTMGVVRTVREYLKPFHEVFVVEMGAKEVHDIAEICNIVHPQAGIVTAVGPQHLESFKTIENVQKTKFELIDSLPTDGIALLNNDFEMIASRQVDNVRTLRYAIKNTADADYIGENIIYSPAGTSFTIRRTSDGHKLDLETRLVGECNISNIIAAAAMAQQMGVSDDKIRYAVSQLEQVEHRLSIKRVPGGMTIIDDAFNSNPVGSAMALDVLASMTPGKRILVTPGMIELGERQEELNTEFGRKAATRCDIAIVVGLYNRDAIVAGLQDGGMSDSSIYTPETFTEAQQLLRTLAGAGDTVLYENDLPDTFK